MNTPITESQVVAYLAERAKYLQRTTASRLASVCIDVSQHGEEGGNHQDITFRVYTHEHGASVVDCRSLEEGIARLVAISSPRMVIARLRQQAEEHLKQAAALEAAAAMPVS